MSEWCFGFTEGGHSNSAHCEQEKHGRSFGMPFVHYNAVGYRKTLLTGNKT